MIGLAIAGFIVAFIIFAELYSIRKLVEKQEQRHERHEDTAKQIKQFKYEVDRLNDSLHELIEIIEESKIPLTDFGKLSLKTAKAIVMYHKQQK